MHYISVVASSRPRSAAIGRPFFLARYLFSSSVGANQFPRLHRADRDTSHIHGTLSLAWIYPQGCSSSSSTSPPPPPLFKFNFSAECIESTPPPERHLVSFSFSSFLESLSPSSSSRRNFRVSTHTPVFSHFLSDVGEEILLFRIVSITRCDISQSSPRVFKETVTSGRAPPSRSKSKSIKFRKVSFENVFNPDEKQRVVVFIDRSRTFESFTSLIVSTTKYQTNFFINRETHFHRFDQKIRAAPSTTAIVSP